MTDRLLKLRGKVVRSAGVWTGTETSCGKASRLWGGISSVLFSHLSVLQCSADLACFVRFDKLDVYNAKNYKQKYKAPTDFCFILKVPSRSAADL